MKILPILLFVILPILPSSSGSSSTVSLPSNTLQLESADEKGVWLSFSGSEPYFQSAQIDDKAYTIPRLSENVSAFSAGYPNLPTFSALIVVPVHAKPTLESFAGEQIRLGTHRVAPAPSVVFHETETEPYPENTYIFDKACYSEDRYFPEALARVSDVGRYRGMQLARVMVSPMQYNPVSGDLVYYPRLSVRINFNTNSQTVVGTATKSSSELPKILKTTVLNAQQAQNFSTKFIRAVESNESVWFDPTLEYLKISIDRSGVYRLGWRLLNSLNVPVETLDPHTLKLYSAGKEVPIVVSGEDDGSFDPNDFIDFYGDRISGDSSYYNIYSRTNAYWLCWSEAPGARLTHFAVPPLSTPPITHVVSHHHYEQESVYYDGDNDLSIWTTQAVPGEGWVWKILFGGDKFSFSPELYSIDAQGGDAEISVRLRGTTLDPASPDHHVTVSINGTQVVEQFFNDRETVTVTGRFPTSLLREGANHITLESVGDTQAMLDQCYLDWIDIQYPRNMSARNDQIMFPVASHSSVRVKGFTAPDVVAYDVTHAIVLDSTRIQQIRRVPVALQSAGANDGDFANITVEENILVRNGRRGINGVALDGENGNVLRTFLFDTYSNTSESDSLASYIERLAPGTVVLLAVKDEASRNLTESAKSAIESLGSAQIRSLGYKSSWALIGVKGAPKGSVREAISASGGGSVSVADTLIFSDPTADYEVDFMYPREDSSNLAIVSSAGVLRPTSVEQHHFENLRDENHAADYLIITNKAFLNSAEQFAEYQRSQNSFRVEIVDVQDIFDEFNYGISDALAIRSFLVYATQHWQQPAPEFVCMWGDASWDHKKNLGPEVKSDFVPTFGKPVSDTYLVCLDGPGDVVPDMNIGRIPVESDEAGLEYLTKIQSYSTSELDDWVKNLLFINGGTGQWETQLFDSQSRAIIQDYVEPPPASCVANVISKWDLDQQGTNSEEIIGSALNQGQLWVNFIGHAASGTWDLVFHSSNVVNLENGNRMPVITSMTCHTARFANPWQTSFSEEFIGYTDRGAIAFLGTTGWGYVDQDFALLKALFRSVFHDTMQVVGEAISTSKLRLFESYGNSRIVRNMILQYSLLGDPAVDILLPERPDLTITQKDISVEPEIATVLDSTIKFNIKPRNLGLASTDSVIIRATEVQPGEGSEVSSLIIIPPLQYTDSTTVKWPISSRHGQRVISFSIDPFNSIVEADESNNDTQLPVYIFSSELSVLKPTMFEVVKSNPVQLVVDNSFDLKGKSNLFYFEVDTTADFDSPIASSDPVTPGPLTTSWSPPYLSPGKTYYWRCRSSDGSSYSNWAEGVFSLQAEDFPWSWMQSGSQFIENGMMDNVEIDDGGVRLNRINRRFRVESAGVADGNVAIISIDNIPQMVTARGHNLVVVNPINGKKEADEIFDTWASTTEAERMARFIENLEPGRWVLAAIKDDGSRNMTENAIRALESIGSQLCRNVRYQDSWAIIGRKGAGVGTVREGHRAKGDGRVVVEDTLSLYSETGRLFSRVIGPAKNWIRAGMSDRFTDPQSWTQFKVLGYNQHAGVWDTLLTDLSDGELELGSIVAAQFPLIKFGIELHSGDGQSTPIIESWQVSYDPVCDLAIGTQVIALSADSVLEGEEILVSADVYNVGQAPVDSFKVLFEYSDPSLGWVPFANVVVGTEVPVDSAVNLKQIWQTGGKAGRHQLSIKIDPDNAVDELSETNNVSTFFVHVSRDTLGPEIDVTFDDQHINSGDYVSSQPHIIARIFDNSPRMISDTSKVYVMLDDKLVPFLHNEPILQLRSETSDPDIRGQVDFRPTLSDGDHVLMIFVKDASGNSATPYRIDFQVLTELNLLKVMNYPNPFFGPTTFTFELTQPAQVSIKIYTVAGRLVKELDAGFEPAGFRQLPWDGLDVDGDPLANGVYLYKVIAKNDQNKIEQISKVIVMR